MNFKDGIWCCGADLDVSSRQAVGSLRFRVISQTFRCSERRIPNSFPPPRFLLLLVAEIVSLYIGASYLAC